MPSVKTVRGCNGLVGYWNAVSELCNLNLADMELEGLHANVIGGKGDKDRIVLFTQRTKNCIDAYLPIRSSRLRDNEHPFLLNQAGPDVCNHVVFNA